MKKNVLLLSLLSLFGLVTSCYDDSELRERIEKLENTAIPSINEQISSIRSSITELQNVDNAIKNSITELQNADAGLRQNIADLQKADEGLGTEIENLKDVDAQHQRSIDLLTEQEDALSTQIANLQTYVDSSLVSQKEWAQNSLTNQAEWVSATFATLEQYASVVGNVATLQVTLDSLQAKLQADLQAMDEQNAALFAGVNERIDSLAKALTQTESSLKTWVGEQFANYYDIAAVDARLAVINDSIVKGDERLATEVASVRTTLAEAQKELTTAYQTAIRTAIEDYNGTITKQIASDIATVNGHIDDEVKRLDDRIDAVEKRVSELEGKVAELLKTLDITFDVEGSVAYSPGTTVNVNYTLTNADATTVVECLADAGWKATVKQTSSSKGSIFVKTSSAGGEGKVLVFANKGDRTAMRVLHFEQGTLQVLTNITAIEPTDTLLSIDARTNLDFDIVISEDAKSWVELHDISTRVAMRTDIITFAVKPNYTNQNRLAVISLVDKEGNELSHFNLLQKTFLSISESFIDFQSLASSAVITIDTYKTTWKIAGELPDWISLSKTTGEGASELEISVQKNNTSSVRIDTLWFSPSALDIRFPLIIRQDHKYNPIDGFYLIDDAEMLVWFSSKVYEDETINAKLISDIDLTGVVWVPIGNDRHRYSGTFDGQHHRIKNLVLRDKDEQALFGTCAEATILNTIIDKSCILSTSKKYTAAFVSICNGTGTLTIKGCGNEANVEGDRYNNAIFVGCNFSSGNLHVVIENCWNTGDISGGWENGIFSGWFGTVGKVISSYNTGKITGGDGNQSLGRGIDDSDFVNTFDLNEENYKRTSYTLAGFTKEWFANGALTYALNLDQEEIGWYQTLGEDKMPTTDSTHKRVYAIGDFYCDGSPKGEVTYSNSPGYYHRDEHDFDFLEGCCRNCGKVF